MENQTVYGPLRVLSKREYSLGEMLWRAHYPHLTYNAD
jgi:hypothetical protein